MRSNLGETSDDGPSTLDLALEVLADEEPTDDRVDEPPIEQVSERPASLEVAAAAECRGLNVTRLLDNVVVCNDGGRSVAFRGFAGSTTSRIALAMCRNDAWVRRFLERCGVPVAPTRLVERRRPTRALRAAEELGYPVALRAAEDDFRGSAVVGGRDEFRKVWGQLRERELDHRMKIIVERLPDGTLYDVAVVGGRAVAVATLYPVEGLAGEPHKAATATAVDVIALLPGIDCASVQLSVDRSDLGQSGVVVLGVDPLLQAWANRPNRAEVAGAVLDYEFGGS